MGYKLDQFDNIIRIEDGAFIPKDEANSDYQLYLKWIGYGNEPIAYEPPPRTFADYQREAKAALDRSDITVARISEAITLGDTTSDAADVIAYMKWRRAVRTIVQTDYSKITGAVPGAIPPEPPYPQGT